MGFNPAVILFPLFLLIFGGYVISRIFSLSEGPMVRVVTDFFMPLLVFHSFCTTPTSLPQIVRILGAVTLVIVLFLGVSWAYCRFFRLNFRAVAPPLLFMNSGFLGIPMMKLWGGLGAMNVIVLYDQLQTFYVFTLGIVVVTGSFSLKGLKEVVRTPLIWSIVLGLIFNLFEIPVHPTLLDGFSFAGDAAPALAVFSIGMSLNRYRISFNIHILVGVLLRFVLGFLFGWLVSELLGLEGMVKTVVIVASSLPSAVFSAVLPIRYGVDSRFASSVLIISTLLSIVTLPLSFYLCERIG
ncbi:MAG: AEC family transporter [Deltaproteobacteria bacterium]|jgi:malate permease and related proteins|nr:AEC family transporter [Deltaproteobacteria bacterium]MBT4642281.1 AEC family transporter [Deltaproteobacteria bacterium]MBT6502593.1 AEC family transporter [Deltaproteobacteria bacterium]MBT6611917.1 AEC family transporter [Deltaproteobacteria bacterium]MBT7152076.1 AEC family transporter [Deltaproteobacteria bacterium]